MRVLFLTAGLAPDDPTLSGLAAAAWLRDLTRHHVVDLVAGYRRDRRLVPSDALGVDLCGRRGVRAAWSLRRAAWHRARTFEPDVVVSTRPEAPRCGRPAVALLVHAPDPDSGGLADRARLTRLAGFSRVVVPTTSVCEALVARGLDAARIVVAPPGVSAVRRRRTPADPLRLLCTGPIGPAHGQHLAIDAVARLAPVEKARVHLQVTGHVEDPVYLGHLRVQAHGQPVSLLPDADRSTDPVGRAHLLLALPLRAPPLHLGLARALVSGVPALWSDLPDLRELTGGLATAVPPNDVLAVRDHIRRLLDAPEALDLHAREQAERARTRLGTAASEARLRAILDEAT